MADSTNSIFTQKASDKLHSPEDLDAYVRVTNPRVWVALAACAALLSGLFAWGFFGTVATSVSTLGTCVGGKFVCFLPTREVSKVHVGDIANVDGKLMEVASLSHTPVSTAEARKIVGSDYLVSTLVSDEWTYVVHLGGREDCVFDEGTPLAVRITTERIAPINLIFGGSA